MATSTTVKDRWNKENYKVWRSNSVKPDLFERIEKYRSERNQSRSAFLAAAIEALDHHDEK